MPPSGCSFLPGVNPDLKKGKEILGSNFSSKLEWCSYIIFITKIACKKIGALIRSMKFLSPEIALYIIKSTTRSYIEYCCHVWAGVPRACYLELLDKLQKQICRTVSPYHVLPLLNPWLNLEVKPT